MRARPDRSHPFHHHARHLLQARSRAAPARHNREEPNPMPRARTACARRTRHPEDPMTRNVIWQDHEPALQPVDETVDHVRGSPAGRLILEYGDYEWPYSRQAFRAIERVEQELGGGVRSATTHQDRIAENGPDLRLRADRRGTLATGRPGPYRRHRERSGTQMVVRRPEPGPASPAIPIGPGLADPLTGCPSTAGGRRPVTVDNAVARDLDIGPGASGQPDRGTRIRSE